MVGMHKGTEQSDALVHRGLQGGHSCRGRIAPIHAVAEQFRAKGEIRVGHKVVISQHRDGCPGRLMMHAAQIFSDYFGHAVNAALAVRH